jgi:undecaprenyl-diphosphatase
MNLFQAIIIAIVEGITEYLPISSTGHMIIAERVLHVPHDEFTKLYTVAIQLGAILSVVVLYWKKFIDFKSLSFYIKLILAVIPALILGYLFSDVIDDLLESPLTVSITLLLGGVVLMFIDRYFTDGEIKKEEDITFAKAIRIGAWQCLAMVPGVSRSAASIIGGMQQGLTRKVAAEFSFFLAVPTMFAATAYKILKGWKSLDNQEIQLLIVGNIVAFIVALLAIKFFIAYLQKNGFRVFGIYRIVVGFILLVLLLTGVL